MFPKNNSFLKSFDQRLKSPFIFNAPRFAAGFDLSDLKAYYKMEASPVVNSASAVGSSDAIATSSLTLTGATIASGGLFNNMIEFDGTDDDASADSTATSDWKFLNVDAATFTIIAWIKMNNFTGTQDPMGTFQSDTSTTGQFWRINSGRTITQELGTQGTDLFAHTTAVIFPNDTASFHMVMVQYDDGTGVSKISVDDGTVDTSGSHNLTNTDNPTFVMNMGQSGAGNQDLDADMDEVSIWNRILTTAEITSLYNGGSGLEL